MQQKQAAGGSALAHNVQACFSSKSYAPKELYPSAPSLASPLLSDSFLIKPEVSKGGEMGSVFPFQVWSFPICICPRV